MVYYPWSPESGETLHDAIVHAGMIAQYDADGYTITYSGCRCPYGSTHVCAPAKLIYRTVDVIRESEHRRQRGRFRSCFSNHPEPTRISIGELYGVLAHGKPGEYMLVGY